MRLKFYVDKLNFNYFLYEFKSFLLLLYKKKIYNFIFDIFNRSNKLFF